MGTYLKFKKNKLIDLDYHDLHDCLYLVLCVIVVYLYIVLCLMITLMWL